MGERQNFYSLQLPEPGYILGPRDSGVTGLFIIRLAVCVVVLSLRLFFFLFRVEVLALEKQCRRRGEKNPPGSLRAPVAAEGLDKPRSFFSSSSFFSCSQSLFSSSVAEGGGWKPGSLFGQAAEQRLGREGKQREANKPTPLAERGRLLSNLQAAAAAKLVGKSRFRFAFPRSEQELVTVPWISSFFHPPPIFFFLSLLFLFHSALKKKKNLEE